MDALQKLTKMRSQLVVQFPFFGMLASRLRIVAAPGIGTMATDGVSWWYDPKYVDECNEPLLIFSGVHEVMHPALGHHTRRNGRDPALWNESGDHVINLKLRKAGFMVPDWAFCDPRFENMTAEDVYRVRHAEECAKQEAEKQEQEDQPTGEDEGDDGSAGGSGDDDGGDEQSDDKSDDGDGDEQSDDDAGDGENDGQGARGEADQGDDGQGGGNTPTAADCPDPGRCGGVIDAAPANDQAALDEAAEEWRVAVTQAANMARRMGEGKLPGFVQEMLNELDTARTNWRTTLREWINPSSTSDYTWAKPNRRMLPMGYIVPGTTSDGISHVGIAVDSSGSVSSDMLKQLIGEAQAALDDGMIDKVTLITADTQVNTINEYVRTETIESPAMQRGGTMFSPAIKWFVDNAPDIVGLVYLSDMECYSFGPEPPFRVLWAGHAGHPSRVPAMRKMMDAVPFGDCLELTID